MITSLPSLKAMDSLRSSSKIVSGPEMSIIYDVTIIGAGLAGLTAGDYLKARRKNIKILESYHKAGGRILTEYLPNGAHIDLGALSFGNGENTLMQYVQRFSLPIIQHSSIKKLFYFKKNKYDTSPFQSIDEFIPQLESFSNKNISLAIALESLGVSMEHREWLEVATLLGLLGDGFQTISVETALTFLKQYDSSTCSYSLLGGNDQLPRALAHELHNNILFSHHVNKVKQSKDLYVVKGSNFTIQTKSVIFAIPLPALQSIKISPALSLEKQKAINSIFYTQCASLSIISSQSLSDSPRGGVFLCHDQLGWFRDQSALQRDPNQKTVITVNITGDKAAQLFGSMEEEIKWKKLINDILLELFPTWQSHNNDYYSYYWKEGYSYFSSNIHEQQEDLKKPEANLYFAGEHTSKKFASMNGALESGIRAAQEILSNMNV